MIDRRGFLCTSAAAAGALGAGVRPSPRSDVKVISHRPHLYHGWPTLTRLRSGRLVVVCSGGREAHVCPFGRVEYITSDDDGETWTWPRVLLDGPIDDRDAGVLETRKGTLLVTTFSSLAYVPAMRRIKAEDTERRARWLAAHDRLDDAGRKAALGVWMCRSTDGGLTWSGRYDSVVNAPHGPVELADGRLLYAGKKLWSPGKEVGVCISEDDGRSFSWLAAIPTRAGDRAADYHELHAVECKSGRLVVHIRNHNKANSRETLQCHSTDGGRTWSTPRPIGVWGLPSHLLRLRDGRLVMSYGHRRKPFGNQARLSDDDGNTWSAPQVISDDGTGGDLGYPSTVELGDGRLLTVWYERLAGNAHAVLRQARWSLPG